MAPCCDEKGGCSSKGPGADNLALPALPVLPEVPVAVASLNTVRYRIVQMDCPTEEKLLRDKLSRLPGVQALEFNLMQRVLTVTRLPEAQAAVTAGIRELGFTPELLTGLPSSAPGQAAEQVPGASHSRWALLALSGVAAVAAEASEWLGAPHWLAALLALVAILSVGLGTYKKGWIALKNRNLNINALMSIAVTGAMLIGQWPEAAMVMFLFTVAELIEARSLDRARNAIRGLLDLAPQQASVRQGDGQWLATDTKTVPVGAIVRVLPGERIGLDGIVVAGRSSVNQAPITGESLPVEKGPGEPLFAGTINQTGVLEFRVTAIAADTTLARIIHAVEEAQGARSPTQRFVDQFSRIYTPVVFALALLVAVAPPLYLAPADMQVWLDWIYRALVLLVIACPCALVISTPVTIVSGLATAARRGILVKGGAFLEMGRNLQVLALDKTGTLTHGKPVQTDAVVLAGEPAVVRGLAASLSRHSNHPVSKAVALAAAGAENRDITGFEDLPGRGVRGRVDGHHYHFGNHRLMEDLGLCSPALEQQLEQFERQGKSVVMLADEQQVLALFAVADTLRPASAAAIQDLHALGIRTLMLTGDNLHTAQAIAAQVGIDAVHANLLPQDKLQQVKELVEAGTVVGMVGDGINDAPALARAHIGFAMGAAGSDTAIETADVALMDDDLRKIPEFVRLSRKTAEVLKQNIAIALGIKLVFLLITLAGVGTLWMAVFADMGASLIVVANGLRLLRRAPDHAPTLSVNPATTLDAA